MKAKRYKFKAMRDVEVSVWDKFVKRAKNRGLKLSSYFKELVCGHHNKSL